MDGAGATAIGVGLAILGICATLVAAILKLAPRRNGAFPSDLCKDHEQRIRNHEVAGRGDQEILLNIREAVGHVYERIKNLEVRAEESDKKLERLEGRTDRIEAKLEKLETKVERLDAKIEKLITKTS